jgi:hypothetical protein
MSRVDAKFEKLEGGFQKRLMYKIRAAFEKQRRFFWMFVLALTVFPDAMIAQEQYKQFSNKVLTYSESIYDFENPENQAKARSVIPLDLLEKRASGKSK